MFNLEESMTEWRQRMLDAGIRNPVPLEELESHLREEFAQRMKSGANAEEAFAMAVQNVGQAHTLKAEFKNAGALTWWSKHDKATFINRVLGLLWLAYCVGSFGHLTKGLSSVIFPPHFRLTPLFTVALVMDLIYLRGLVASLLLIAGVTRERRVILLVAILDAAGGVAVIILKPFQPLSCTFTILGFISIWLLWPRKKSSPATK